MELPPIQLRILGALLEKEATTPDVYPLSLNSLTAACNQLTNREPVMSLTEIDVRNAVNALRQESLVRAIQPAGSKVMKFQQLLSEKLDLDARERAIIGVLMLRGPQTLAEIRTRTARLAEFPGPAGVEETLTTLANRQLVAEQPRRPGQKELRYAQLLGGPPAEASEPPEPEMAGEPPAVDRVGALEATVDDLQRQLAELRTRFEEFQKQFS
jgi:uncharacterized protein YceH (UPF0502 family)